MKRIQVSVGIVLRGDGSVLVAERKGDQVQQVSHSTTHTLWEFPGGKVEAGETAYQALIRELNEEIGITVHSAELLLEIEHDYGQYIVELSVWIVRAYEGEPSGLEGQAVQWLHQSALETLNMPLANQAMVRALLKHDKSEE